MDVVPCRAPRRPADIVDDVFCHVSHDVQLEMRWKGRRVLLAYLGVPKQLRGRGLAEAALTRVCELADAAGWDMTLQPSDGFGSDKGRLARWYLRHGFVPAGAPQFVSQIRWMNRPARSAL